MRVTFEQSGGFAGLLITKTIDSETLSPSEAEQLQQLVQSSDFFRLTPIAEAAPQPDRFEYSISIDSGNQSHTIDISETNIPDQLRPLLSWIQAHAR